MNQVNGDKVIDILIQKIALLERQNAILQVQLEELVELNNEMNKIEGEYK